jgi:nitrous-oxide reductase
MSGYIRVSAPGNNVPISFGLGKTNDAEAAK